MNLVTIDTQFDNEMKSLPVDASVFKNILNLVKNPLVVTDKSKIPQWKFCTTKGTKRCTENIGLTNVLILDFDDSNYTYQEFESRFREYKYILHTSYSYDGSNSKFRVLLFLNQDYEINKLFFKCHDETFSTYKLMLNYFPHIDPASFVKAQFFKMPAVKGPNAPYYFNIHDGKLFDPNSIEGFPFAYALCEQKQEEYLRLLEAKNAKKRDENQDMTKAMEYIKRKFEEMPAGMRHNGVFSMAAWFKGIGGTYSEFKSIQKPSWADRGFDKQIKRLETEWYKLR